MLLSVRQKRAYRPTAPLYARDALTFLGRPVARGEQVPEAFFSSPRHRLTLWRFRKVAHAPRGAFAAPAVVAEPVVAVVAPSAPAPSPAKTFHRKR